MSITFINQTKCKICDRKINTLEDFFSFPPFIQNTKDPFYKFNDSTFHLNCLNKHSLGKKAMELAKQYFYNTRPENRRCIVDGKIVDNYNDYIFIDVLTSNEEENLYKFNLITLNRNNVTKWGDRNNFLCIARKFLDDGKWSDLTSYKYLNKLIFSIWQEY